MRWCWRAYASEESALGMLGLCNTLEGLMGEVCNFADKTNTTSDSALSTPIPPLILLYVQTLPLQPQYVLSAMSCYTVCVFPNLLCALRNHERRTIQQLCCCLQNLFHRYAPYLLFAWGNNTAFFMLCKGP